MPKLLTFGVCRQAIVDRDTNSVSLVGLINTFTVMTQADQAVPLEANSPVEWGVVTSWLRLEEDKDKTFDQRARLVSPNGDTTELSTTVFTFDSSSTTRILTTIAKASGFPVGQAGTVRLMVDVKEAGTGQAWGNVAEYPLEVVYQTQGDNPIVVP